MDANSEAKKEESKHFSISLDSIQDFEFRVKFNAEEFKEIVLDEPPPVGHGRGPNPGQMLAAAVGSCLSASLLFCARKLRLNMQGVHTDITVTHARSEKGRLRIGKIDVAIDPRIVEPDAQKLQRCLDMYEDFCVVTQSVRKGLDVSVKVKT
jgi:uncharacterized OsmC-like protein